MGLNIIGDGLVVRCFLNPRQIYTNDTGVSIIKYFKSQVVDGRMVMTGDDGSHKCKKRAESPDWDSPANGA